MSVFPGPPPVTRVAILTVSDTCARGEKSDGSGNLLARRLSGLPAELVSQMIVADDRAAIVAAAEVMMPVSELLAVTGGTGLSPRDVTPQALGPLLDYEIPGMAEAMRSAGRLVTPHAMLSRQLVGVAGQCLVLALPGSLRAVEESLAAVWPVLPHALELIAGRSGSHPRHPG